MTNTCIKYRDYYIIKLYGKILCNTYSVYMRKSNTFNIYITIKI